MAALDHTPEEWGERYAALLPQFQEFEELVRDVVERTIAQTQIDVAQIETRTKTVPSLVEKITRKDKYTDPLVEITDLVGVRIIVYDSGDCVEVGRLIKNEFRVDTGNSPRWSGELDPGRFGYMSDHYVVRFTAGRCKLSEYRGFASFRAEIQVRTVMQHAWAAVDHKVRYKGPDLPPLLQRKLFRLSALVELADQEFSGLLAGGNEVKQVYADWVARGEYSFNIDALSLAAYFEANAVDRRWAEMAVALGYNEPSAAALDVAALLRTIEILELRELGELDAILTSAEAWGEKALETILDAALAGRPPGDRFAGIWAHREAVLSLLLLVHAGSEAAVAQSAFRLDIQEALLRAIAARSGSA